MSRETRKTEKYGWQPDEYFRWRGLFLINIQHDPIGGERRPIFDVLGVRRESEPVPTMRVDVQLEFAVVVAHTLAENKRVLYVYDRVVGCMPHEHRRSLVGDAILNREIVRFETAARATEQILAAGEIGRASCRERV